MLRKIFSRSVFPYLLSLSAFVALLVVGGLLWREMGEHFPKITPGEYIGEVRGLDPVNPAEVHYFYLSKQFGQDELLVAILAEGWQPQILKREGVASGTQDSSWSFPLIVANGATSYRLSGEEGHSGIYQGKVVEQPSGQNGTWVLRRQPDNFRNLPSLTEEQRLWLSLKAELSKVEIDLSGSSQLVPKQKEEIEKLTEFVTDGKVLRARADQKLSQIKSQLTEISAKLKARYQEAKTLEGRIELSQRVTGMGKLVSLARDTLEREARWSDSLFKTGSTQESSEDLEQEYQRGLKVLELKHALSLEQDRTQDSLRDYEGEAR